MNALVRLRRLLAQRRQSSSLSGSHSNFKCSGVRRFVKGDIFKMGGDSHNQPVPVGHQHSDPIPAQVCNRFCSNRLNFSLCPFPLIVAQRTQGMALLLEFVSLRKNFVKMALPKAATSQSTTREFSRIEVCLPHAVSIRFCF